MTTAINKTNAQSIIGSASQTTIPAIVSGLAGVEHISCDAMDFDYNGNTNTIRVFAWSGSGLTTTTQGWAFEFNGVVTQQRYLMSTTTVEKAEIAIVSNATDISVVVVYNEPTLKLRYEVYQFDIPTSTLSFLKTKTITLGATTAVDFSVAGDEYGHAVIVWENYTANSTVVSQTIGHLDLTTGELLFAHIGAINYNGYSLLYPDVDITYDNTNAYPEDAVVYLTFVVKDPSAGGIVLHVLGSQTQCSTLVNVTPYNIFGTGDVLAYVPMHAACSGYPVPSIAVGDGYHAFVNGPSLHATIGYSLLCGDYEYIKIIPVDPLYTVPPSTPPLATDQDLNLVTGTPLPIRYATNTTPCAVAAPRGDVDIVVWNLNDLPSTGPLWRKQGLAHASFYNGSPTFDYLTTNGSNYDDMAINSSGTSISTPTPPSLLSDEYILNTASGFNNNELIYFFYDNVNGDLLYKPSDYSYTQLRKANTITEAAHFSITPNPANSTIKITSVSEITELNLRDESGRLAFSYSGDTKTTESALNGFLTKLHSGFYLAQATLANGKVEVTKFIKH